MMVDCKLVLPPPLLLMLMSLGLLHDLLSIVSVARWNCVGTCK